MNDDQIDQMMKNADLDLKPDWATGLAETYMQPSAQLCTRDGRRMGNAIVAALETRHDKKFAVVVSDAGSVVRFTERELEELFHQPKWLMNLDTHLGIERARLRGDL
jgi:hypothetical protein